MKKKILLLASFIVVVSLGLISTSFKLLSHEPSTTIHVYRPQESMMSGGRSLEVKFYLNDTEVATILSGTKLNYKLYTTGEVKVKFVAEFGGSGVGSPYVNTMTIEEGQAYHIGLSVASLTGVKGEILDEGGVKKMSKEKFADETNLQEGHPSPAGK